MVRLAQNGSNNGRLIATFNQGGNKSAFFYSTNDGSSWSTLPDLNVVSNGGTTVFEVPQTLGSLSAGTLLWATAFDDNNASPNHQIKLYKSTDLGNSWTLVSTPVSGNTGLWEPHFIVDSSGKLLMFYASEEHKNDGYNQLIAYKSSTDGGSTWSGETYVCAINDNNKRPGMPVITKLGNGTYALIYEMCGSADCNVYLKTSANGSSWGTASDFGTRIESTEGRNLKAAPYIAWANDGTTNGVLVAVGQLVMNTSNSSVASVSGKKLMINKSNGTGSWTEVDAPVEVDASSNICTNYSSALLPSTNGQNVLMLAGRNSNDCRIWYNTRPIESTTASAITSGNYYRLINKYDATQALHLTGNTYLSFTDVFNVVGTPKSWNAQEQLWKIESAGNGYYKLTNKYDPNTSLHLTGNTYMSFTDVYKMVGTPKSWNVDQQLWSIESAGNGYYKFINKYDATQALHLTGNTYMSFTDVYNVVGTPKTWNIDQQLWQLEDKGTTGARLAAQTDAADERLQTLQAYPNPADGELTVRFDAQQTERVSMGLVNALGVTVKRVFEGEVKAGERKEITLSTTKITAGTYFISVEKLSGKQTTKVLIIH